jgi:hypothetical protein
MTTEVTKSIIAENTFSDEIVVQGYFNVSVDGIAGGTIVTLQRISGVDGTNFQDVDSFSSNTETYGYEPEAKTYRIGVNTGDFGSGTCKVRIGQGDSVSSSSSPIAFNPLGDTITFTAASSAPTGVQAPVYAKFSGENAGQYCLVNTGNQTVFIGTGSTAALAQAAAVEPTSGNPASSIPLPPNAVYVLNFNKESYFSGVCSVDTEVYVTPGQGL